MLVACQTAMTRRIILVGGPRREDLASEDPRRLSLPGSRWADKQVGRYGRFDGLCQALRCLSLAGELNEPGGRSIHVTYPVVSSSASV